jgi:transcriptional regulator with XRE-family HTH domain
MPHDDEIELRLAQHLRSLRLEQGLKLSTLAERTGISAPHLSRLESGDRQPSIGALLQLARAYGMSLSQLVGESDDSSYHLVRAGEGEERKSADATYRILSGPGAQVGIVEAKVGPGKTTGPVTHDGVEWLHLLAGSLELLLDDEAILLETGDSIQFDAAKQHQIRCRGRRIAKFLLVSSSMGALPH